MRKRGRQTERKKEEADREKERQRVGRQEGIESNVNSAS